MTYDANRAADKILAALAPTTRLDAKVKWTREASETTQLIFPLSGNWCNWDVHFTLRSQSSSEGSWDLYLERNTPGGRSEQTYLLGNSHSESGREQAANALRALADGLRAAAQELDAPENREKT